jgi:nitroreductase
VDGSLGLGSLKHRTDRTATERGATQTPSPVEPAPETEGAASVAAPSGSLVDLILNRRSASKLEEPGPTDAELEVLLRAAATVPDHGGLQPWRFAVVRGAGRAQFGDALAAAAAEAGADPAGARDKAFAAPALIAVIAAPKADAKIPVWEQLTTASASGYAITLAAHAIGLGAAWRSTAHVDGSALRALLGMSATDQLLGWVNLGRPGAEPDPAPREAPDLEAHVVRLG